MKYITLIVLTILAVISCATKKSNSGLPAGVNVPASAQVTKVEAKQIRAKYAKDGYLVTTMLKLAPGKVMVLAQDKKTPFITTKDTLVYKDGAWVATYGL